MGSRYLKGTTHKTLLGSFWPHCCLSFWIRKLENIRAALSIEKCKLSKFPSNAIFAPPPPPKKKPLLQERCHHCFLKDLYNDFCLGSGLAIFCNWSEHSKERIHLKHCQCQGSTALPPVLCRTFFPIETV